MNSYLLKIIAIISMTFDHYSVITGEDQWMRIVGRLSFPIFAFLLGEGYKHTRNRKKYFYRLFIYALLLQVPSFFIPLYTDMNIFFTLAFGVLALIVLDNTELNKTLKIIIYGLLLVIAEIMKFDYGSYGILLITLFYFFKDKKIILFFFTILNFIYIYQEINFPTQVFSLLALLFIFFYNQKQGRRDKYFFYLYYPAHILVLYLFT